MTLAVALAAAGLGVAAAVPLALPPAPVPPLPLPVPRVGLAPAGPPAASDWSLPVPPSAVTRRDLLAPHHDYPASDLMVPTGTPVFAVTAGTARTHEGPRCGLGVTVTEGSGRRFVSCHLAVVSVSAGAAVAAGDVLGLSGDSGNARGVPHLHFHVLDEAGRYVCPQALFPAWAAGRAPRRSAWSVTSGCSFPRDGSG